MTHTPLRDTRRTGRTTARRWLAAAAVTATALAGATAIASADTTPPPADNSAAPPAVEDFTYPGADTVTKVKLGRGDGHILLGDCAKPTQIQIWTRAPGNPDNRICFTVAGTTGTLTLQLPDVFAVQTSGGRSLKVGLTVDGAAQTLDVPKDGFKGIGEGTSGNPAGITELTVTG
ncbi:hypothetical protein ACGF0D_40450 [Kitasatospora sp. NPDC048298]|uniref:hypothetical protein n=1 Tax=Kitasatospora sp. NPDC048298 TaxID=3364049 RepID=UPI0037213EB9